MNMGENWDAMTKNKVLYSGSVKDGVSDNYKRPTFKENLPTNRPNHFNAQHLVVKCIFVG